MRIELPIWAQLLAVGARWTLGHRGKDAVAFYFGTVVLPDGTRARARDVYRR